MIIIEYFISKMGGTIEQSTKIRSSGGYLDVEGVERDLQKPSPRGCPLCLCQGNQKGLHKIK